MTPALLLLGSLHTINRFRGLIINSVHIRKLLSGIAMFRTARPAELDMLAAGSRIVSVPKENPLFHQGDPCTGFYLVLSGSVRLVFISADGREHIAKIATGGDHFGEAVMFLGKPFPLSSYALEESELLFIGKEAVDTCLKQNHDFARILIANLSTQLHHFANQIAMLTLHKADQRVIGYLLRYIEANEQTKPDMSFTLPAKKTQYRLAPEHLTGNTVAHLPPT